MICRPRPRRKGIRRVKWKRHMVSQRRGQAWSMRKSMRRPAHPNKALVDEDAAGTSNWKANTLKPSPLRALLNQLELYWAPQG